MNNAKKIADEIDEVTEGFKRLPVHKNPPKVKWGEDFKKWDDEKKIKYLMKFAEAMNHAADTIQKERDRLGKMVEEKETQLEKLNGMLDMNNQLLQHEVTRMNQQRQEMNSHAANLNARIRELERGE